MPYGMDPILGDPFLQLPEVVAAIALLKVVARVDSGESRPARIDNPRHSCVPSDTYLIDDEIGNQIDLLLDTGEEGTDLSTVVDFCSGEVQVIRQGVESCYEHV